MKTFTKEQLIIIKLANALSRMIDAAEEASATQDAGEYAETVDFLNQNRRVLDEAKFYISDSKATPQNTENAVYISDPNHVLCIGKSIAFDEIKALLEEAIKEYKVTGLKLALTIIDSFVSDFKASLIVRNIKHAAKYGLNINDGSLAIQTDDNGNIMLTMIKEP